MRIWRINLSSKFATVFEIKKNGEGRQILSPLFETYFICIDMLDRDRDRFHII